MTYFRVSLGQQGAFAAQAFSEGWIGVGWMPEIDLTDRFTDDQRAFNQEFVPVLVESGESPSRISAGLGCAATWTVGRGIQVDDIVISSTGKGEYQVGRVTGGYFWAPGQELAHRRPVEWSSVRIAYASRSEALARSLRAIQTVQTLDGFDAELDLLCAGEAPDIATDDSDDSGGTPHQSEFEFERHLEDFLAKNWGQTEFGTAWSLLTDDSGAVIGRQYPTDTGPLDLLAINKAGDSYLVIELKRGRASDAVVGQILRYMGYIQSIDPSKSVQGLIIALNDDLRLQRALEMVPSVEFRRYEISFKLV